MRMSDVPPSIVRREISSRICAWIVTSRAVVGSSAMSSFGSQRERHGDHHALAHAARELVRVALEPVLGLGDAHHLEQLDGPGPGVVLRLLPVGRDGLGHLLLDGEDRVEAGHRVLEDHRDVAAADLPHVVLADGHEVLAVEQHPATLDHARRLGQQAHDREVGHALAAPGLADEAEALAARQLERDPVDGVDRPVVRAEADEQVLDVEQRLGGRRPVRGRRGKGCHRLSLGSSDSRRPSPSRLNPIALMTIAAAGKSTSHGAV